MTNETTNAGKTALVTGASGGIGLELVKLLAADGYNLVLVARNVSKLTELADELRKQYDVAVHAAPEDLSDPFAPTRLYDHLGHEGLRIDILINNAGFGKYGLFHEIEPIESIDMLHVNVTAPTHLTRLLLPGMIERGWGRVMNVASTAAFQPGPLMAVYFASKAYLLSFSEAIANELRGTGVTVTALCPGPTRSGFQARAGTESLRTMRGNIMTSETVARIGYRAMMDGRAVVIPGSANALMAWATRLAPRGFLTRMVRWTQEMKS